MDELVKVSEHKLLQRLNLKFETLNPFQSKFFNNDNQENNIVLSAPTGAGKSLVMEIAAYRTKKAGKKVVVLEPMRSLAKEKYDDWTHDNHRFKKFGVSIMTGDFKLTPKKKEEVATSGIIIMTSEMLDSRSRRMNLEGNAWLKEVGLLIVDESHIIGMWNDKAEPLNERGHRLEAAIMRFTKLNPNSRVLLLSATLPNLPELGQWLTKLNNKVTDIIVSEYRPQPLEWHLESYPELSGYGGYHTNKNNMFAKAIEVLKENRNDMWLLFVHSKTDGRRLQELILNELELSVSFHSADLEKDERLEIEKAFRSKKSQIIIATSTLAYGMNLPARRVMILDDKRGLNKVHAYDIKQMGGRAGRPGIDPRGDVHWIVGSMSLNSSQHLLDNMPAAKSLMFDTDVFAFHIVAEIAEGGIKTREQVYEYYDRCLANLQGAKADQPWLDKLIKILIDVKAIKFGDDQTTINITNLGKIASWMYFSPFDIYNWYTNMYTLCESKRKDDAIFAWMWGSIRSHDMGYIPADCKDMVGDFQEELSKSEHNFPLRGGGAACAGLWMHIQGKEKDIPPSARPIVRGLIFDVERHMQAISLIDSMYGRWEKALGWKMLCTRIKYGCDWDCAKLCLLDGIGKVKAGKLIEAGIKSIQDMHEKEDEALAVLGQKAYDKAIGSEDDVMDEETIE